MWTYDDDDELKNKLKCDIIMWYEHWYMGSVNTLTEHLKEFEKYYDPQLFDDEDTRKEDIVKFLTFLQNEVDKKEIE